MFDVRIIRHRRLNYLKLLSNRYSTISRQNSHYQTLPSIKHSNPIHLSTASNLSAINHTTKAGRDSVLRWMVDKIGTDMFICKECGSGTPIHPHGLGSV